MRVARDWYDVETLNDGICRIHERHVAHWLRCNIWHVRGRDRDLVIDTGMGVRPLQAELPSMTERPLTAIVTHSHFDHSGGLHEFAHRCGHCAEAHVLSDPTLQNTVADTGYVRADTFTALPYEGFSHENYIVKPAPLTEYLDEGDVIDLGDRVFKVFHLPGHSPGSIALFEERSGVLFSGDVVYDGDLIDNLYHSDADVLSESLERLKTLPVTTVHGGHFKSFGRERMVEIISEYQAGERRISNASDWLSSRVGVP